MARQQGSGLDKAFVNVDLTQGVNLKQDPHQMTNGQLLRCENAVYSAVEGQITKRFGCTAIRPKGAAFQGGPFKAIGCRDNSEPIVIGQNTLNRYNVDQNLSTSLPIPTQGRLEVAQIQSSTGKSTAPIPSIAANTAWPPMNASIASDGTSYVCAAWEEPTGSGANCFYGVQDLSTGNWIISPKQFTTSVSSYVSPTNSNTYSNTGISSPLVRYANGYFYIFYLWTGQYNNFASQDVVVMTAMLYTANLAAGLVSNNYSFEFGQIASNADTVYAAPSKSTFDVHFSNGNYIVGAIFAQGTQSVLCQVGTFSGTGLVPATNGRQNITPGKTTGALNRIAVKCDGPTSTPYAVATSSSVHTMTPAPNLTVSTYTPSSGVYLFVTTDVMWVGNQVCWSAMFRSASWTRPYVAICSATCTLINRIEGTTPVNTFYVEPVSRMFQTNTANKLYQWFNVCGPTSGDVYTSTFLFECDISTLSYFSVCRTLYLSGYGVNSNFGMRPTDVVRIPNTQRYVTLITSGQEKAGTTASNAWRAYGTLNRVLFDFSPARMPQVISLPTGGVMVAGGYNLYYDGNDVVEAGFSNPPTATDHSSANASEGLGLPSVQSVSSGLAGGANAATTSGSQEYYYVICFVRRDSYGNVYRSAPSPVVTVACPNAVNSVTFPVYTANNGGNIQIEYYRSTQTTPGTYYKIATIPNGTQFVDTQPDYPGSTLSITRRATVYTNSGELPNDPPPACHHVVMSENRGYMIPADSRNVIWYSKQFSPGRSVEWCANLTLSEGLNSGQFTGLAILDSNLIVFKNDQILYTYGNGPDNTGNNGGFNPFQKISSDVGCVDPGSIANVPDGIVFRSRRGIELLTRSLQVVYIGIQIEPAVAAMGPISSTVVMPNYTELRFVPSVAGQPVLCLDYAKKRWSTFSNMASVQAVNIQGNYWWISADGTLVYQETPGQYLDNGQPVIMTLETREIPVGAAGAQGIGRVYRMALLGDFFSDHALLVSFAYDHQLAYTDTTTFTTSTGLISGDTVYQFRCSRLPRSVMQTLKLKFQDTGVTGQSCAISDLVLEVASKNGLAKLAPQKTV